MRIEQGNDRFHGETANDTPDDLSKAITKLEQELKEAFVLEDLGMNEEEQQEFISEVLRMARESTLVSGDDAFDDLNPAGIVERESHLAVIYDSHSRRELQNIINVWQRRSPVEISHELGSIIEHHLLVYKLLLGEDYRPGGVSDQDDAPR